MLDGEVAVEQLDLTGERDLVILVFEGGAEEVAEVGDEFVGGVGVAVDEGGDGVEGVEEKVGLELEAEGVEAGLVEAGGEYEGLAVAVLGAAVIGEGVGGGDGGRLRRLFASGREGQCAVRQSFCAGVSAGCGRGRA